MQDPHDLQRFVQAQDPVYEAVLAELRAGEKRTHWMWFIFPQLRGLGVSATAHAYGISSLDQARAYVAHPVLGARLQECTQLVLDIKGRGIEAIFGYPDHLKFHSCMTLFSLAAPQEALFGQALQKYFSGTRDKRTLQLLGM